MIKKLFVVIFSLAVSDITLSYENYDLKIFSSCVECYKDIYDDVIEISENIVNKEYLSGELNYFLSEYDRKSSCMNSCMPAGKVYYDACNDRHYIPSFRLSSIKREVRSSVSFIGVLRDAIEEENVFTGRSRSGDLSEQYKIHHYKNRHLKIEEALDEINLMIEALRSCRG